MLKKIIVYIIAFAVIAFFSSVKNVHAFADENNFNVGDEVELIFNVGKIQNVAGISAEALYSDEYLEVKSGECFVGGNIVNVNTIGKIRWNFIVYNGMDFDDSDVTVVSFEVKKSCSINQMNFRYNCEEIVYSDLNNPSNDFNSIVTVRAIHNGLEYKVNAIGSESGGDTDVNSNIVFNTDTNANSDITSDINFSTENTLSNNSDFSTKTKDVLTSQNESQINYIQNSIDTSDSSSVTVSLILIFLILLSVVIFLMFFKLKIYCQ